MQPSTTHMHELVESDESDRLLCVVDGCGYVLEQPNAEPANATESEGKR